MYNLAHSARERVTKGGNMPVSTMEKLLYLLVKGNVVKIVWCRVKRNLYFPPEGGGQSCGCTGDIPLRLERVRDVVCEFDNLRISRLAADGTVLAEASATEFNELFFACWSVAEDAPPSLPQREAEIGFDGEPTREEGGNIFRKFEEVTARHAND